MVLQSPPQIPVGLLLLSSFPLNFSSVLYSISMQFW